MADDKTKEPKFGVGMKIPKDVVDRVHAQLAGMAGITVDQLKTELKAEADNGWCKCDHWVDHRTTWYCGDIRHGMDYANEYCVDKHHWHCAECDKLMQVG